MLPHILWDINGNCPFFAKNDSVGFSNLGILFHFTEAQQGDPATVPGPDHRDAQVRL